MDAQPVVTSVYILLEDYDYEGYRIHGVYGSPDAAKRATPRDQNAASWTKFEKDEAWEAWIGARRWQIEKWPIEGIDAVI